LNEEENEQLRKRYIDGGLSYKDVKYELAAKISEMLSPIQKNYETISDDEVRDILVD
jgi:tryptophanyl-tRNA synthetase